MTRLAQKGTGNALELSGVAAPNVLRRLARLQEMPTAELKNEWRQLFGSEGPPFSRTYLQSRLAHRIQELAYGGIARGTVARLEAMGEKLDGGNVRVRRLRADDRPIAGTRLLREYQGIEHVVAVLAHGFEFEGRPYRSLSAIARHVTGTRWNGWSFFGLRGRSCA